MKYYVKWSWNKGVLKQMSGWHWNGIVYSKHGNQVMGSIRRKETWQRIFDQR